MISKIREFYENSGFDYNALLRRLMGKEALVQKFITLFLSDSTYSELTEAVKQHDNDQILLKAHTLKGMALNLEFTKLGEIATNLVQSLRNNETENTDKLIAEIQQEYERIFAALTT